MAARIPISLPPLPNATSPGSALPQLATLLKVGS
jgi:hypothetical protein